MKPGPDLTKTGKIRALTPLNGPQFGFQMPPPSVLFRPDLLIRGKIRALTIQKGPYLGLDHQNKGQNGPNQGPDPPKRGQIRAMTALNGQNRGP